MRKTIFALMLALSPQIMMAISPEDVIKSSFDHFPKVLEAIQNIEIEQQKLVEGQGAFDGKLKGSVNSREDGFYTGDEYKLSVEKPLPYLNSKIYGGHRQSFGVFPGYEGKSETLSDGENFLGLSVSLLKNALIDINRFNIQMLEQNKNIAEVDLQAIKVKVQTMALKSYWTWVIKGHEVNVYRDLYNMALRRGRELKKRVDEGDLAQIYLTENEQYILKRKSDMTQKDFEFKAASFYISLFNRDQNGDPMTPDVSQVPMKDLINVNDKKNSQAILEQAMNASFDLQLIDIHVKQAQLDVKLGRNEFLPSLDLSYEWSKDQGAGSKTLAQNENRVMLNLELPLQYRKGRGKVMAGEAKLRKLHVKRKWLQEKMESETFALVEKSNGLAKIYNITLQQVDLAKKLVEAEKTKFNNGASDLILLNLREQNLGEAQMKNLSSLLKYKMTKAEILELQGQFL